MPKDRVYCFIAMRFGEKDTDAIYDKIAMVVSELGLQPRRVDRLEHIENINKKIIDELDEADIAIADLTYARPSVYFEAGYAHRKIPVIYTCRKDHLHNKDDNLKAHFDVDRYSIIFWDDSNDESFTPSLKSRLQTTINDLVNLPLINDLNNYLVYLNRSGLNPENLIKRNAKLFSLLNDYPKVELSHLNHERNIKERTALYNEILKMIQTDFLKQLPSAVQNQLMNLAPILEEEVDYLEMLYEKAKYGSKVMYANYLSELYKVYLDATIMLYSRPSLEYGKRYDRVKSMVERVIQDIEKPVWK